MVEMDGKFKPLDPLLLRATPCFPHHAGLSRAQPKQGLKIEDAKL